MPFVQRNHGMGAYPDEAWFDKDRPSWMPYWIDTLTESAKKYGMYPGADLNRTYPRPPAPYTPAPPPISTDPRQYNDPTLPQQADDATKARAKSWVDDVLVPFFTGVDDETEKLKRSETPWLLYASLAAVGLLLVGRGR